MDERKSDDNERTASKEKPLFLDMGLGSREQGFTAQKPKLKLVHSRDGASA